MKEGSGDAVLEEMEKLYTLLFHVENKGSRASEESILEAGINDCIAHDQWNHAFVNNDV